MGEDAICSTEPRCITRKHDDNSYKAWQTFEARRPDCSEVGHKVEAFALAPHPKILELCATGDERGATRLLSLRAQGRSLMPVLPAMSMDVCPEHIARIF